MRATSLPGRQQKVAITIHCCLIQPLRVHSRVLVPVPKFRERASTRGISTSRRNMTLVARCFVPSPLRGAAQWRRQCGHTGLGPRAPGWGEPWFPHIFPSNAFMAFARSLHTFNCSKKMNCELCKAVYTSIASKALVMDQYTVSERSHQNKTQTDKANKQTKHTKPQQNQTKQDQREVGSLPALRKEVHDDILCVIMSMATENEAKRRQHGTT